MEYVDFSRYLVTGASVVITIGLYMQAFKILRTRSAKDFTPVLIAALALNEVSWLNYGLSIHEWPIYLVSSVNVPAIILTVVGYCLYRNAK